VGAAQRLQNATTLIPFTERARPTRPAADVAPLELAARNRGVPLRIIDIGQKNAASFHGSGMVLSRPDQHVAWRGDGLPADPLGLIDRVRGAAS